jgi:hypothetical protein
LDKITTNAIKKNHNRERKHFEKGKKAIETIWKPERRNKKKKGERMEDV